MMIAETAPAIQRDARELAESLADWAMRRPVNRTDVHGQYRPLGKRKKGKGYTEHEPLTREKLVRHFLGASQGDLIGLHTTSPDDYCLGVLVDVDQHGDDEELAERNEQAVLAQYTTLCATGFNPLLTDTNGRGGYHLAVLFESPIPASAAYHFARWIAEPLDVPAECFPKQPALTTTQPFGNWVRLPGRHHTFDHWTRAWDGWQWLDWPETAEFMLSLDGDPPDLLTPGMTSESAPKPSVAPPLSPSPVLELSYVTPEEQKEPPFVEWVDELPPLSPSELSQVYAAIDDWIPTGPKQRQKYLFQVARRWLAIPALRNVKGKHLQPFVRAWWERAVPFITDKDWLEDTWLYFLRFWDGRRIRHVYGDGRLVDIVEAAQIHVPVAETSEQRYALIAAVCFEAWHFRGKQKFPMDCRALSNALHKVGVPMGHVKVWRYLRGHEAEDNIHCEYRGHRGRDGRRGHASEYIWLGKGPKLF